VASFASSSTVPGNYPDDSVGGLGFLDPVTHGEKAWCRNLCLIQQSLSCLDFLAQLVQPYLALPQFCIDVSRPPVLQFDDRDLRLAGLLTGPGKRGLEPEPVTLQLRGIALDGELARRGYELLFVSSCTASSSGFSRSMSLSCISSCFQ
jgi:hypothetical protein